MPSHLRGPQRTPEDSSLDDSDNDIFISDMLSDPVRLPESDPKYPQFLGKSSSAHLIQDALNVKEKQLGEGKVSLRLRFDQISSRRPDFWKRYPVRVQVVLSLIKLLAYASASVGTAPKLCW
jgi:hypothetical protein